MVKKSVGDVEAFKAALISDNFEISDVEFFLADTIELYNEGVLNNCNGNNADNPYFTFKVPKPEIQEQDNLIDDMSFYLRADEAIVLVGLTPPKAKYFSYRSFIGTRTVDKIPKVIYASLGDTINFMNINTQDLPDGDNPFSMPVIITTTADKGINARVQAAAEKAGYSRSIMNTDIIPSAIVKMGLDADCDTFSYLARTAMFDNPDEGKEYQNNPDVVVFRVTPKTSPQLDPYPTPTMRIRGTGMTEMDLMLMDALKQLRKAILDHYSTYSSEELRTEGWLREGYDYIQTLEDGIGECRDTSYLKSTPSIKLPASPDDFLIVYGVNHAATNKCTYANFITYGEEILNGVASVNSEQFSGTAKPFLPGNPAAKYLYVWKVARQSSDDKENCLIVPSDDFANGIPLDKEMFIGFRAYVEPKTQVGPVWQELFFDRVIRFSKKK